MFAWPHPADHVTNRAFPRLAKGHVRKRMFEPRFLPYCNKFFCT